MNKLYPFFLFSFFLFSCSSPNPPVEESEPEVEENWGENSTIYEVNLRQMTQEGTFKAFQQQHLDRLADLGVEILWFMPIYPIGEKNRKGTLGSYYSVKDYTAVNPEHGSLEDFRALVDSAHAKGMKVILDWVANHTAWDNTWVTEHPDWYSTDSLGNMIPPVADWADVVDLNYDNPEMRKEMISSMKFWLKEVGVDGFRCDVAEWVPVDFWVEARAELDSVKPIFFLAEGENHELFQAFDMTYSWSFHHLMNQVAKGEMGATDVAEYWASHDSTYAPNEYQMQFITNHDENSWNGTAMERMGDNRKAFAVLSFTVPGMPLIYSGQESDMDKRLEFFEKDPIEWKGYPLEDFYKKLVAYKWATPTLRNGEDAGPIRFIETGNERVLAYTRGTEEDHTVVLLNFSDEQLNVELNDSILGGYYSCLFSDSIYDVDDSKLMETLPAHGYRILTHVAVD